MLRKRCVFWAPPSTARLSIILFIFGLIAILAAARTATTGCASGAGPRWIGPLSHSAPRRDARSTSIAAGRMRTSSAPARPGLAQEGRHLTHPRQQGRPPEPGTWRPCRSTARCQHGARRSLANRCATSSTRSATSAPGYNHRPKPAAASPVDTSPTRFVYVRDHLQLSVRTLVPAPGCGRRGTRRREPAQRSRNQSRAALPSNPSHRTRSRLHLPGRACRLPRLSGDTLRVLATTCRSNPAGPSRPSCARMYSR